MTVLHYKQEHIHTCYASVSLKPKICPKENVSVKTWACKAF